MRQRVWEAAARGDEDEIQLMVAYLGADPDAPDPQVFNFTVCARPTEPPARPSRPRDHPRPNG